MSAPTIGQGQRKHPYAKVGDTFGAFTVTATMPRGHKGRSDERVEWKCTCGRWGTSYVFNLRKALPNCNHDRQAQTSNLPSRKRAALSVSKAPESQEKKT